MANNRTTEALASLRTSKPMQTYKCAISLASEDKIRYAKWLSSGNYAFDYALGGGFRQGRFHTFYGPESSGKSHAVWMLIARLQASCARCFNLKEFCTCGKEILPASIALILSEDLDHDWVADIGVDTSDLLLHRPSSAEEGLDAMAAMIETGSVDLVCLDSLAFLTSEKELCADGCQDVMAVNARAYARGFRKIITVLNSTAVRSEEGIIPTIVLTNQIRMNLAVMFGDKETKSGGWTPMYAAATETRFAKPKTNSYEDAGIADSSLCKVDVKKNKTGTPFNSAEYRINFVDSATKRRGGVIDEPYMISTGRAQGLITQEGNKWRILGKPAGKTMASMEDLLRKDIKLREDFWQKMMEIRKDLGRKTKILKEVSSTPSEE